MISSLSVDLFPDDLARSQSVPTPSSVPPSPTRLHSRCDAAAASRAGVAAGAGRLIGANSLYLVTVTALEYLRAETLQNYFYQYMFLGHLILGLLLIVPFLVFAFVTWPTRGIAGIVGRSAWVMPCSSTGLVLLLTGLLLTRAGPLEIRSPTLRRSFYWLHVMAPLVIIWLYWLHRLAGPPIRWRLGLAYLTGAAVASLAMIGLHTSDPRPWYQVGSASRREVLRAFSGANQHGQISFAASPDE